LRFLSSHEGVVADRELRVAKLVTDLRRVPEPFVGGRPLRDLGHGRGRPLRRLLGPAADDMNPGAQDVDPGVEGLSPLARVGPACANEYDGCG
jgi:hypothetical protein